MRVLAIDTALNACAVALVENESLIGRRSEAMERGHAERLTPMVREVMEEAGAAFETVARLVVTTGPGSFTGVRVGLAFARAAALALDVPCVGLSTLEALALQRGESGWRGARLPAPGGVYAALYRDGAAVLAPTLTQESALAAWPEAVWASGTPDVVALGLRGARLDPAVYSPKPLYLRAPDARPAVRRMAPG